MTKKRKFLLILAYLSLSILLQIIIIFRLNYLESKLENKTKDSNIIEQNNDIEIEETTENDINFKQDYSYNDIDQVLSDDELSVLLENSLFIGDSRTEGLMKFTKINSYSDFCCGVGYNITDIFEKTVYHDSQTFKLLDSLSKFKYKSVFINLGYNELGWQYPDTFIEKYGNLINKIKEISPSTKIYIQSLIHVSQSLNPQNDYENNERINLYNTLLTDMCNSKSVSFLDLNPYFDDEQNNLSEIATTDGIHFNSEYCNYYLYQLIQNIKKQAQ